MDNLTPERDLDASRTGSARSRGMLSRTFTLSGLFLILGAAALVALVALATATVFLTVAPGTRTMTVGLAERSEYEASPPEAAPAVKTAAGRTPSLAAGTPRTDTGTVTSNYFLSSIASASEPEAAQRKVIKDASVSVEVGSFASASDRAASISEAAGGYVQSSSAQATRGELRSGTIVLRVPQAKFEAVLAQIEGLGRLRSKDVVGRDVTEEYVDLEARLSNWQQQEKQLLAIMGKATKVADILQVQAELGRVREEIERIMGRLKYLNSRMDLATITAEFFEPAVVSPVPRDWGFVRALQRALAAFVNTINAVIVLAGGIAPVVVLAIAAWGAAVAIRRRRTR